MTKFRIAAGVLTAVLIILNTQQSTAQTVTSNKTGDNGGFYYSFWNQGGGSVTMTLGAAGNYSVTWSSCTNFTCGKGWRTGSNAPVCYSGTFNGGSNGYLALYGWTKNPLIEYYIVESYGSWTPPGGTSLGTVTSDGDTYKIYKMRRTNAPSIIGNNNDFDQYWSVRTNKRTSGTITVKNHFDAWASKGMQMGSTFDYQIIETEGYQSSGSSNITVSSGCTGNIIDSKRDVTINPESKIHISGKELLIMLPSNNQASVANVQIFTISGKKLFSSALIPHNASLKISNLDLSRGAYYASIQCKDKISVVPFVKSE